ncbi:FAD-binding and (Fe-S)-binding domain-containing protein [Micromonospora sp. LOL_023]|uniref:FAD-binding and (Fe-S)-binding domain-containing protein n=1 Tax=Micromonospora sp. LOL_023 TaxID=3345418 RepID=UPI003A8421F6
MTAPETETAELRRRLQAVLPGGMFDTAARAMYASDASNYRQLPLGVVLPRTEEELISAVVACRDVGAPVVLRGGGTSLGGQACGGGVVIDTSRYLDRILAVDPVARTARVQPGVLLDSLRRTVAPHGLTFGPDPSTHGRCTIGGMIGNNACGSHSVAYGTTAENVVELDILLYDGTRMTVGEADPARINELVAQPGRAGEIYRELRRLSQENLAILRRELSGFSRRISGYPLDQLLPENRFNLARALVGTEGTCAIVLSATVRLVPVPAAKVLLVLGYDDDCAAAEDVANLLPHQPLTIEGLDRELVNTLDPAGGDDELWSLLPEGQAWLFVEVGAASLDAARQAAAKITGDCAALGREVVVPAAEQRRLWRIREDGAGIATRMAGSAEAWPGWEDAAVPPARLAGYLREFKALRDQYGLHGVTYGHFGEGCVHVRLDFDLLSDEGVRRFRSFVGEAADLVAAHGGSLSGEHGDGQARGEFLSRMYSPEVIELFARFKGVWDPDNRLNPGMIVRPFRVDENLRLGSGYRPLPLATVFSYPDDHGDFAEATRRCIGVGKCRDTSSGVMCPSYMVTKDELHSTRGRAHLLFEMSRGDLVTDGWRSTEVRDALDLCLSCKGCKSDCPTGVDVATYKAEFLHHHYKRRLRPTSHYSMGFLPLWARLARVAPVLINQATGSRLLAPLLKRLGGIAPQRQIPRFTGQTFLGWFRARRGRPEKGRTPVLLWVDTFTNHFSPEVGRAAVEVLESAGYDVRVAPGVQCCGLTWISTGQLGVARRVARRSLDAIDPFIAAGMPMVALEPSCAAAFRSDLPELLDDPRAQRAAEATTTLAALLARTPGWRPPRITGAAITQTHCHQHAVLGDQDERKLMADLGLDNAVLDSGCCGLAGNFGFEAGHYEISMAAGERVLLPEVRAATEETLIVADGFSCRTQIAGATDRQALHLAEVIRSALGGTGSVGAESAPPDPRAADPSTRPWS